MFKAAYCSVILDIILSQLCIHRNEVQNCIMIFCKVVLIKLFADLQC